MSHEIPAIIRQQMELWLAANGAGNRNDAQALSTAYKQGDNSAVVSLSAYLTTRMPATFAAVSAVLEQMLKVLPDAKPASLLDIGAGPGTASMAAQIAWPSLNSITMVEADQRFAALAAQLNPQAKVLRQYMNATNEKADVVIAAYVFAELPEREAAQSALKLWVQASDMLIIVEPGTPKGFARIRAARNALIIAGAHLIGPCTHANVCPMVDNDWCHFKTRLPRSRAHMQAKSATVPFEDESFSWLAVSRHAVTLPKLRIIAPSKVNKVAVTLKTCGAEGLSQSTIASRDKPAYKLARNMKWGDGLDV
ncbi:MAG: small ribosomal subunit Rsm22 family protein [Aestuariivirga sp.]